MMMAAWDGLFAGWLVPLENYSFCLGLARRRKVWTWPAGPTCSYTYGPEGLTHLVHPVPRAGLGV